MLRNNNGNQKVRFQQSQPRTNTNRSNGEVNPKNKCMMEFRNCKVSAKTKDQHSLCFQSMQKCVSDSSSDNRRRTTHSDNSDAQNTTPSNVVSETDKETSTNFEKASNKSGRKVLDRSNFGPPDINLDAKKEESLIDGVNGFADVVVNRKRDKVYDRLASTEPFNGRHSARRRENMQQDGLFDIDDNDLPSDPSARRGVIYSRYVQNNDKRSGIPLDRNNSQAIVNKKKINSTTRLPGVRLPGVRMPKAKTGPNSSRGARLEETQKRNQQRAKMIQQRNASVGTLGTQNNRPVRSESNNVNSRATNMTYNNANNKIMADNSRKTDSTTPMERQPVSGKRTDTSRIIRVSGNKVGKVINV